MSEQPMNNNTTSSFSMADLMKLAAKIPKPEPIMAFQGTAAQLAAALPAPAPPPFVGPVVMPSPFLGLDVVEEDGWVYIGTTRQLSEAQRRWGSLSAARRGADLFKTPDHSGGVTNLMA